MKQGGAPAVLPHHPQFPRVTADQLRGAAAGHFGHPHRKRPGAAPDVTITMLVNVLSRRSSCSNATRRTSSPRRPHCCVSLGSKADRRPQVLELGAVVRGGMMLVPVTAASTSGLLASPLLRFYALAVGLCVASVCTPSTPRPDSFLCPAGRAMRSELVYRRIGRRSARFYALQVGLRVASQEQVGQPARGLHVSMPCRSGYT